MVFFQEHLLSRTLYQVTVFFHHPAFKNQEANILKYFLCRIPLVPNFSNFISITTSLATFNLDFTVPHRQECLIFSYINTVGIKTHSQPH